MAVVGVLLSPLAGGNCSVAAPLAGTVDPAESYLAFGAIDKTYLSFFAGTSRAAPSVQTDHTRRSRLLIVRFGRFLELVVLQITAPVFVQRRESNLGRMGCQ